LRKNQKTLAVKCQKMIRDMKSKFSFQKNILLEKQPFESKIHIGNYEASFIFLKLLTQ